MTIPTYDQFIEPILRFLVQHPDGIAAKQAHDAAATALGLSDEERQQLLASGTRTVQVGRMTDSSAQDSQAHPNMVSGK
jgi:restriction system protein